jgi:hypothetical protein
MGNKNLLNKKGKCINIGNCKHANSKQEIEITLGNDFFCPECGLDLVEIPQPPTPLWRWLIIVIALLCAGIAAFYIFRNNDIEINVVKENLTVTVNENQPLPESVIDAVADKQVEWQSSDPNIATISNNTLTAHSEGEATVTATANDKKKEIVICSVTVKPLPNLIPDSSETSPADNTVADNPTVNSGENAPLSRSNGTGKALKIKTYSCGKYEGSLKNGYPEGEGKMTYSRRVQIARHDTNNAAHYAESGDYFIGSWGNGDIVSGSLYDKNGDLKEKIIAPKRFNIYNLSNDL